MDITFIQSTLHTFSIRVAPIGIKFKMYDVTCGFYLTKPLLQETYKKQRKIGTLRFNV